MPDAPSAPNPIQNFVNSKNPEEAIRILQNSGLNKDQLYEMRRNLHLDGIAPNNFLLADNAWNAAEALKKLDEKDFLKFKAQFGRRYKESAKAGAGGQPVEKNLGRALGAAMGFATKKDERKKTKEKKLEQKALAPAQVLQASTEPTRVEESEELTAAEAASKKPEPRTIDRQDELKEEAQNKAQEAGTETPQIKAALKSPTPDTREIDKGRETEPERPGTTQTPADMAQAQPQMSAPARSGQSSARPPAPVAVQNAMQVPTRAPTASPVPRGEQGLGNIKSTTKRRIEQSGTQGKMQAEVSTRETQNVTPAQVVPPKIITQTNQIKIQAPQADQMSQASSSVSKEIRLPGAQVRKSKREAFQSPQQQLVQNRDSNYSETGDRQVARIAEIPANSEEGIAKIKSSPTPPPAPKMPPGTPYNIKPGAILPIERLMSLGAQQYKARRGLKPTDQRSQVMGERTPGESSPVLPDIQELNKTAYTSAPSDELETKDGLSPDSGLGGGAMVSDLEAIQQMQASQQRARRSQRLTMGQETGIPGMEEEFEETETGEAGFPQATEEMEEPEEGEVQEMQEPPESAGMRGQFEKFASNVMQQRARLEKKEQYEKAFANANKVNLEQNVKNLQNMWRVFNGTTALSFWGFALFLISANLQMINKYSFKVRWIPPTSVVEDLAYLVMDFLIFCVVLMSFSVEIIIIALVALLANSLVG